MEMGHLREADRRALEEFRAAIRKQFSGRFLDFRLFGSKARGDDGPESDIDVLLVTKEKDRSIREAVFDLVVELNLKYDVVLSPVILTWEEYVGRLSKPSPFYQVTQKEGVPL